MKVRHLFGPRLAVDVRVCRSCRRDALSPIAWNTDDPLWRVRLRCSACGHQHDVCAGPTTRLLLARAQADRMAGWTDTFVRALRTDLIDASDFAPPDDTG